MGCREKVHELALAVLNAGLVYLLARGLEARRIVAAGAALVCLFVTYSYEGVYIVLEPAMVFFALSSLLMAFRARGR